MTVLILVVVDNGLVQNGTKVILFALDVLILVVVDNGLVHECHYKELDGTEGLNPCCSGQWSRTAKDSCNGSCCCVLILVVVDNGLVH